MSIYADSTFFVSYYLRDSHLPEVLRRMAQRPRIWLTSFQRVELIHATYRHVFRKNIRVQDAELVLRYFQQDCDKGLWVSVNQPNSVFSTCERVARMHVSTLGVRTLDSLHVAAALDLGATHFWTFDRRQARLAEAEGLFTA